MWTKSLEVLNPYEAIKAKYEKEHISSNAELVKQLYKESKLRVFLRKIFHKNS